MKILLLCEGDAETRDSWSGATRGLVRELRVRGHAVIPVDVDLHGPHRKLLALRTLSADRQRWRARYRLGPLGFQARSRAASRGVRRWGREVDLILQIGATFRVDPPPHLPLALFCDSNIDLAMEGARLGVSIAEGLEAGELGEIRRSESSVYRGARHIFAMSRWLEASLAEGFQIPRERLQTVYCGPGVPPSSIPPRPGPWDGPPTILHVGREFRRKGGPLLLEAFRRVRDALPDARLVMVGAGPPSPTDDHVDAPGFLDREDPGQGATLDRAYREAHVFCLPTRFEPFGAAFVEAMLHGLPCVGPDRWAVPEIILQDQTGTRIPSHDPERWADALIELLQAPDRAFQMGQAGRERAMERFTWRAVVDRMEPVFQSLGRGSGASEASSLHHGSP